MLAVFEPRRAECVFGGHGAKGGIGNAVCPWLWRKIFGANPHTVFVRLGIESAESIPEEESTGVKRRKGHLFFCGGCSQGDRWNSGER